MVRLLLKSAKQVAWLRKKKTNLLLPAVDRVAHRSMKRFVLIDIEIVFQTKWCNIYLANFVVILSIWTHDKFDYRFTEVYYVWTNISYGTRLEAISKVLFTNLTQYLFTQYLFTKIIFNWLNEDIKFLEAEFETKLFQFLKKCFSTCCNFVKCKKLKRCNLLPYKKGTNCSISDWLVFDYIAVKLKIKYHELKSLTIYVEIFEWI